MIIPTERNRPRSFAFLLSVSCLLTAFFLFMAMALQAVAAPQGKNQKGTAGTVRPSLSACSGQSLYLDANGTVWAWGDGLPGNRQSDRPVPIVSGATAVASGFRTAYVLRTDGSLWAWGDHELKSMGQDSESRLDHVMNNVREVRADFWCALAVKQDGSLWEWGYFEGKHDVVLHQPFKVITGISQARIGPYYTLALDRQGKLHAWDRSSGARIKPRLVKQEAMRGRGGIVDFACEFDRLAVLADGSAWFWGDDDWRILGDNIRIPEPAVIAGIENVKKAGFLSEYGFLFLKRDGMLWILGDNVAGPGVPRNGRLWIRQPEQVAADVEDFASGSDRSDGAYAIILKKDGTVWAWGNNEHGQLGDGTRESREVPARVVFPDDARPLYTLP